ncbi:hypothetical protein [Leptothoe kymatousa]|uniref:Uncharacterized protein n=1 Tax=Leptothoe kymatousa TAU-MAC 1615 TaxID=2364775 RepID=A0ABS5Y0Q9_9CYAN|nr:hypothetical protein [Leptothoe kymatousa]MBT9311068.1 hypothetical protein [Leptothoe kymatousa TAU-MAC 1615]
MAQNWKQPLSTLRDIILTSCIKLGLMPWITWLIRRHIQRNTASLPPQPAPSTTSEGGTIQDHGTGSTWYAWFNDNIDDFYTADPAEAAQPLDPTDLVNSLLNNQVTLWHHPEFAPWLVALTEPAFYQWPAEIPLGDELTQPQQVSSPATQQQLAKALRSLPPELIHNIHIQELVLMYLGAGYDLLEQLSTTPLATATKQERAKRHQERYEKDTTPGNAEIEWPQSE